MPSTGIPFLDRVLGGGGYPTKSAVLLAGPPGIGKEALGYYFVRSGTSMGDFCLYITRLSVDEVLQDGAAFGWNDPSRRCYWIASGGGDLKLDLRDLDAIYDSIKAALGKGGNRKVRVVIDITSPLLVLYAQETVYSFLSRVIGEIKQYDSVLVATAELGMHSDQVMVALQALFDGNLELRYYGVGLDIFPLLRVGKMRGSLPTTGYFRFGFSKGEMRLEHAEALLRQEPALPRGDLQKGEQTGPDIDEGTELAVVFNYLVSSFIEDYATNRLPAEKSGWRSRGSIIESTSVGKASFYGAQGKYGPLMGDLMSRGLVETCFFPGERGRGGEIVKLRIAYEKASVKALVQKSLKGEEGK